MLPALLLLLAGLSGAPAVADGASCPGGQACLLVTVTGSTEQQVVVTGDDLDSWGNDIQSPPYRTHSPGSTTDSPRPGSATSIPAILKNLVPAVPVSSVTFVTARASADATATRLGPGDLSDPADHGTTGFQGNTYPGFWADTDRQLFRFARPMRSDDDLNYQDVWTTSDDGMATLVIHTSGTIVHPQIQASTSKTVAGTSVGFSATFAEGSPPPGATYAWSFGDGTTATGPDPTHTWKNSGTYSVNLDTGASDGSEGSATPVRVQVGAKPKPPPKAPPTKAPGTGTGPKHHTVTGPTTGTGTTSNGTTTDSGSSVLGGATTSTPGTTLGSVTPSTPTTTTPSEVSGTGTEVLPEGTPVDGILLVSDATASAATAPKAAPVPAASARAVPRLRWDRGLLWLLAFPVLLAAGGLTQTRWWVRRLPTLPWRTG